MSILQETYAPQGDEVTAESERMCQVERRKNFQTGLFQKPESRIQEMHLAEKGRTGETIRTGYSGVGFVGCTDRRV